MSSEQQYIRLGSGCLLIEEEWFVKAMGGLMSERSFRKWMQLLQVSPVRIGKKWFYEQAAVEMAVTHVTMLGKETFAMGCDAVRRGRTWPTRISAEERAAKAEEVERELLRRKRAHTQLISERTRTALRTATRRITEPVKSHAQED